jgi:hypothetical protein
MRIIRRPETQWAQLFLASWAPTLKFADGIVDTQKKAVPKKCRMRAKIAKGLDFYFDLCWHGVLCLVLSPGLTAIYAFSEIRCLKDNVRGRRSLPVESSSVGNLTDVSGPKMRTLRMT